MNAGFIRRTVSFFADFLVIASIVSILFTIAAKPLYTNSIENFDTLYAEWEDLEQERADKLVDLNGREYDLNQSYDDGDITTAEYEQQMQVIEDERDAVREQYTEDNYPDAYRIGNAYLLFSISYHVIAFLIIHVSYMIILKGHSIGRKLMKLKLVGHVSPFTIILREFFWKFLFYAFTFGLGLFVDVYMIILRTDKKTLRDHFSRTRVILEDIEYPF